MTEEKPKMTFEVRARRIDAHGGETNCKSASITLGTDLAGRTDAFNPAELLMAALAACVIKGIERVTPLLKFELRGVEVRLHGIRQDVPPRMESIDYEILVDTDENDHRLALLHDNVKNTARSTIRWCLVLRCLGYFATEISRSMSAYHQHSYAPHIYTELLCDIYDDRTHESTG